MLQASLESLGGPKFDLTMVGTCYKSACRILCVMLVGVRVWGRLVVCLVCMMAKRSGPWAAVLKVDRVEVKEYGQVVSWEGVI